jgi:hypothetical protein
MPKKSKAPTVPDPIDSLIYEVRRERVILDADLARIYGVETRTLNQAVRRNLEKFPPDFLLQLTREEAEEVRRSRSQIVILKRGHNIKFLPYAFTEHGAIMAANILNSPQAVQMSVFVVRAFIALRRDLGRYTALRRKLAELERTQKLHGDSIAMILEALRQLEDSSSWAYPEGRRLIGFRSASKKS